MYSVIDHLGINCTDYARSQKSYDTVLGVLGYTRQLEPGVAIGYGRDGQPTFWIADVADVAAGDASGPNREVHVAFSAADREQVRAFLAHSGLTHSATRRRARRSRAWL
jgi:catechol 2,3-dioxygenase-like lactoylglutathione lyase family enzyme